MSPAVFALIAEDASNSLSFIRRVSEVMADVNISGQFRFRLESSIGAVVTTPEDNHSADEWISRLNAAVLKSSRTGLPEIANNDVTVTQVLREVLSRLSQGSAVPEGMYWVFQSINVADTGEIFGFEALMRWELPGLGLVPTQLIVDVAEDLNLIQLIDFWALAAVEENFSELVERGAQAVSVNVSAQTLGDDHEFFHAVERILPRITASHITLIFELTETSIIRNQVDLRSGLIGLRERGARTAIDDFGTGQTSLSMISRLPTDFVKLDGSLLEADRPDLSRGLIQLGMKFAELVGAEVILEKVETKADYDLARKVGAQYVQGWYFGEPLDLRKPSKAPKKGQ
jgi:EAL domain-containing protein (putative c-di-GMP-specific phosphodiesterase class I)